MRARRREGGERGVEGCEGEIFVESWCYKIGKL